MPFSERLASILLLIATLAALLLANSPVAAGWAALWHLEFAGLSAELWVNDALMAVFFLLVGLELRRELTVGELSSRDRALLPAIAALGGMAVPAAIYLAFNAGTPASRGFGIPMATDIAFTLGVLALLGSRVPPALRAFIVAFAVIDDLGAILVIALFYSDALSLPWLAAAMALWLGLIALNRLARVGALWPYLLLGAVLWWLMLRSGVHATLAGVLLAFAVPSRRADGGLPADRLEHALSGPVALVVIPVFALANAGVALHYSPWTLLTEPNAAGILLGLVAGKPLGISLAYALALGIFRLRGPDGLRWTHVLGAGLLGGIGFTMSVFITNLAFPADAEAIARSKVAILSASLLSAVLGAGWLALSEAREGRGVRG